MFFCKILPKIFKKLVSIFATSTFMTKTSKKDKVVLKRVLYIYYLLYFQKNTIEIKALLDFGNKVNAITPAYILKLDF